MRLILLHPEVASRSCEDCQRYAFDDWPGRFAAKPMTMASGRIVLRATGSKPPCRACPKQPASVPEAERSPATAAELSPRNAEAYRHYRECRAVGDFPADPIVRRNAAIIRDAEDESDDTFKVRLAVLTSTPRGKS